MTENRLITIAIHTYEKAILVKSLLEKEGIEVALQNVNLEQPTVSSGVRVRIHENDLALALRIIENAEIFTASTSRDQSVAAPVLVPTDFSEHSRLAGMVAFDIARLIKAPITFLYSYVEPENIGVLQLSDALNYDQVEAEDREKTKQEMRRMMDEFTDDYRRMIKEGVIEPVKFNDEIVEGIPEESILEYSREISVPIIVMGTRGAGKKERELVGSVTAEVLDSCRVPVFTVPESATLESIRAINDIVLFSNLEQSDILALDAFYRMFPYKPFHITIVHVPGRRQHPLNDHTKQGILDYCGKHYPNYKFSVESFNLPTVIDDFNELSKKQRIQLIVVPNKKRNAFTRLFNPSIAHRLLFHADIPMMVIPA